MTVLVVPEMDAVAWPTLGPQVCDFIETYLVFGPGDLRGERAKIDDEKRGFIYSAYEIWPEDPEGWAASIGWSGLTQSARPGDRRFDEVDISIRKGLAKTELAAWIAAVELHPDGPVRCGGWRDVVRGGVKVREPVGVGVNDPYIPMVAYTEEQTEDLAYAALKTILELSEIADDFDIGLERIMRIMGDGKAQAMAAAPDARDGARTTFQHFDETHRFTLSRLKEAYRVMKANLAKRRVAQPWQLTTTTAYSVGENSVAEDRMKYARELEKDAERARTSRVFFFHRQASEDADLTTREGLRAALVEATGGDEAWHNIDGILRTFDDPTADLEYLYRVWLNLPRAGMGKYFAGAGWNELGPLEDGDVPVAAHRRVGWLPPAGDLIVAGFDGARFHDATALIGTHVETGFQWPIGIWGPPARIPQTGEEWEVDKAAVKAAVELMFETWNVWRMYCDPPEWDSEIEAWQGRWGDKVVVPWWTRRLLPMAQALLAYRGAMLDREVSHNGDREMASHIANCVVKETNFRDDKGERLRVVRKERPDSPMKIDAAVAGCLSWEARGDAIAAGAKIDNTPSVYEEHGIEWI